MVSESRPAGTLHPAELPAELSAELPAELPSLPLVAGMPRGPAPCPATAPSVAPGGSWWCPAGDGMLLVPGGDSLRDGGPAELLE